MHVAAIESISRQWRQFEKCRAGIDQKVHALTSQHFAARGVSGPGDLAAAAGNEAEFVAKLRDEDAHDFRVAGEIG